MRADVVFDRWLARGLSLVVAIAAVAGGAGLAGVWGALIGGVLGAAGLLALDHLVARKAQHRRRLLAQPWPEAWRRILVAESAHYRRLPPVLQRRFEDHVRIFLDEKRISGVEAEVTEELRLLVAASAVTLSVGWPHFTWGALGEVLLYPQAFDDEYEFHAAGYGGMAHPSGTLILSIPALRESFTKPRDGYHAGYHEFAHLLDREVDLRGVAFDGLPLGLPDRVAQCFEKIRARETRRIRRGTSVLREYGAWDPVEFFAVAVEAFFELPVEVRAQHPRLYELLSGYFQQDPAGWEGGPRLVEEPVSGGTDAPPPRPAAAVERPQPSGDGDSAEYSEAIFAVSMLLITILAFGSFWAWLTGWGWDDWLRRGYGWELYIFLVLGLVLLGALGALIVLWARERGEARRDRESGPSGRRPTR